MSATGNSNRSSTWTVSPLGATQPIISPLQTLGYFYSQTRLYIELGREEIGFAEAHEEAASLVIAYGDLARGRAFAEKIFPIWMTVAGSDSSRAIYYKTLARDPRLGDRYGFSMSWKTSVDEIPQGLAPPDDFENWLWKRLERAADKRSEADKSIKPHVYVWEWQVTAEACERGI